MSTFLLNRCMRERAYFVAGGSGGAIDPENAKGRESDVVNTEGGGGGGGPEVKLE